MNLSSANIYSFPRWYPQSIYFHKQCHSPPVFGGYPLNIIQCLQPPSPMFILHRAYLNLCDLDAAILLAELIIFWLPSITDHWRLQLQRLCHVFHPTL